MLNPKVKRVFDMIKADARLPDEELWRAMPQQVEAQFKLSQKQQRILEKLIDDDPDLLYCWLKNPSGPDDIIAYAGTQNAFRKWSAGGAWGPHAERKRTVVGYWKQPHHWVRRVAASGTRPRVCCGSLSDWLDNQVPQQWRLDLAQLIEVTPELDGLLLTKRIENFRKLSPWPAQCPPNVWLGITTESQEYFDRRWPILARIPATVRFISYEPALGPLTLRNQTVLPNWIICSGQSGAKAFIRTMDPAWARALRDECAQLRVAFFMKQMTGKRPIPDALMVRESPATRSL
jgi:protein gp37